MELNTHYSAIDEILLERPYNDNGVRDYLSPYTGRNLTFLVEGGRITFKYARPKDIKNLISFLTDQLDSQFTKDPNGHWRNK